MSSWSTESNISWPIPGQENIVSVKTEPSIIVTIVNIKEVTTGSNAFRAACLSLILFCEIPFALAVRIKSSFLVIALCKVVVIGMIDTNQTIL